MQMPDPVTGKARNQAAVTRERVQRLRRIRKVLPADIRRIPAGCWLALVVLAEVLLALAVRVPSLFAPEIRGGASERLWVLDIVALSLVPIVVFAAIQLNRQRQRERAQASESSGYIEKLMRTSREWLWAVDHNGTITFSSPMCGPLIGYTPSELVGSPIGLVLDPADLAAALKSQPVVEDESSFNGLVLVCRHRDGSRVLMEVTGHTVYGAEGTGKGFEGTARALDSPSPSDRAAERIRERVTALVSGQGIVTAFQPIRCLRSGTVIGAEALSRFPTSDGTTTEAWFMQAASIGMEAEMELLALRTALHTAAALPRGIFVAINLSPGVCLDPRVLESISQGTIHPSGLVLEVTERQKVDDYGQLLSALAPLRSSGVRVAIDDAGAGFASMQHIVQLKPDLIKLDRTIIRDIDSDRSHRALGAAIVGFAAETAALLVAEGIETAAELDAVTTLGMTAGQGYFLGRPSLEPVDWALWQDTTQPGSVF
ncbi:diguanylate phosphodiesterase [Arthrobacter sp. FB24]|nr:diguanylate phosphodiesterase [Arthrobacter sp. FB24]